MGDHETYKRPVVTVWGQVSDMTRRQKPGTFFDFFGSTEGSSSPPVS
jgi:hypothetical protein